MITFDSEEREAGPFESASLTVGSGDTTALAAVIDGKLIGVVIGEFDPDETFNQAFGRLSDLINIASEERDR
jgi:hypothetical protein